MNELLNTISSCLTDFKSLFSLPLSFEDEILLMSYRNRSEKIVREMILVSHCGSTETLMNPEEGQYLLEILDLQKQCTDLLDQFAQIGKN